MSIKNVLSIDVEDWRQSTLDHRKGISNLVVENTELVLDILRQKGVKATFFVLGLVAEKYPDLVRAIHDEGHEVQSHGYVHELVFQQSPHEFAGDVQRSKELLEEICGREIYGYRAPDFSITRRSLWALAVLDRLGFRYDSSIYPIINPRYGIANWPRFPMRVDGLNIVEAPIATLRMGGVNIPVGGGGYFRLLPYRFIRWALQRLNNHGQSAIIYLHPYEFAPQEWLQLKTLQDNVTWWHRLNQGLGRAQVAEKVNCLLDEFEFTTMREVLRECLCQ